MLKCELLMLNELLAIFDRRRWYKYTNEANVILRKPKKHQWQFNKSSPNVCCIWSRKTHLQ